MIRAFVGVRIAPDTVESILQALSQIERRLTGVRWVARENFHFTLKFLGDVEERRIKAVGQALEQALGPFSRFSINAKGIGVFPDLKRPRILWVGLAGPPLGELAAQVESALEPVGFPREKRAFKPHLTVGRWRSSTGSEGQLGKEIERWQGAEFGASPVTEVVLFQSVLDPGGAVYRPLHTVALAD